MRNVWLISVAFFFIFGGFGTAQQYLVVLFKNAGQGDLALISLFILYGTFLLTGIFITKFVPILGGLKRSLIIGACTYALFTAAVALGNTPLLLIASALIGFGGGLLWVCSGQIISDSSDNRTAGRNFGFQIVGQNAGNIAGIYGGGYLVQSVPMPLMFSILALVVLCGIILLPFIRPTNEEVQEKVFKPLFAFDKRMLVLFPLLFGAYFLGGQAFVGMSFVVLAFLGIGAIPLMVAIFKIGSIAGSFSIGTISDRLAKNTTLASIVLVALAGVALFTMTSTLVPLLAGAIIIGFTFAAVYPVVLAWLKERLDPQEYLQALGIFHVYTNIGVVSALIANMYLSPRAGFVPGAIALVIALPGIFLFHRLTRR